MGFLKNQMIEDDERDDLEGFFEKMLEREEIDGALSGIAKQLTTKGERSLSVSQKNVLNSFLEKYKSENKCERCSNGNVSNTTDYIEIADTGLCPMCNHDKEKFMADNP